MKKKALFFNEKIRHFTCGACDKWWAIGDAPEKRNKWFCPWCGEMQTFAKDEEAGD